MGNALGVELAPQPLRIDVEVKTLVGPQPGFRIKACDGPTAAQQRFDAVLMTKFLHDF